MDGVEFARSAKSLRGRFEVAALDRLHDRLASTGEVLEYELTGYLDEKGKPGLHCRVRGVLQLLCQRCLQPMSWDVVLDSDLLLVVTEAELAEEGDDPEAPDRVLASRDMDVQALVEDEVLLGLPLAPMHPEGACRAAHAVSEGRSTSPFAALAALRTPGAGQRNLR